MKRFLTIIFYFLISQTFAQKVILDIAAVRELKGNESIRTVNDLSSWIKLEQENELLTAWDYDKWTFEVIARTKTYKYSLLRISEEFSNGIDRETLNFEAIDSENNKCTVNLFLQKAVDGDIIISTIVYPDGYSLEYMALYKKGQVQISPKKDHKYPLPD